MAWQPEKHDFKRGDELIWSPGFRSVKKHRLGPHEVIYISGHKSMRASSRVYLKKISDYAYVLNTRLFRPNELVKGQANVETN